MELIEADYYVTIVFVVMIGFRVLMELMSVLIDKDSVIFRASVENDLSYCYSPKIMLSDLKDWYLMLS